MIFSCILNRKTCRVYDIGINSLYSQVASRGSLYLYVYLKKEYDGKQEIRDSIRLRFVRRGGMRLCRYLLAARRLPSAGGNGKNVQGGESPFLHEKRNVRVLPRRYADSLCPRVYPYAEADAARPV